mgnify:CR=1 FL=1
MTGFSNFTGSLLPLRIDRLRPSAAAPDNIVHGNPKTLKVTEAPNLVQKRLIKTENEMKFQKNITDKRRNEIFTENMKIPVDTEMDE